MPRQSRKPIESLGPGQTAQQRYYRRNRDRIITERLAHYHENKEKLNRQRTASRYGFTLDEYDALHAGATCRICGATESSPGRRLAVDHNHETGEVRGLLCNNCNRAIGLMGDDPERLLAAAAYLRDEA